MKRYYFCFGYCTPAQTRSNHEWGADDESSRRFVVVASTDDEAMARGVEVADAYVRALFLAAGTTPTGLPGWRDSGFAHWLEEVPSDAEPAADSPAVSASEYPDFRAWIEADLRMES